MSKSALAATHAPTMIIPSGTEIRVDGHGQLSVRTPGNLVIQNSGYYGTIESVGGSIRIEADADVEAVSVQCADTCFVEGSLTAWRVAARAIHLEDRARANIVLQQTDRLEVGRGARLVGNFSSEKELFVLFSRFAQQLRSIPFFQRGGERSADDPSGLPLPAPEPPGLSLDAGAAPTAPEAPRPAAPRTPGGDGKELEQLPDPLFFAYILLERELRRAAYGPTSSRILEEIVKLLQARDLETLRLTYRTLFARIVEPGPDLRRAGELVAAFFAAPTAGEARREGPRTS